MIDDNSAKIIISELSPLHYAKTTVIETYQFLLA